MCRIAAYLGPPIPMENIITRPVHSLLSQSQHAEEAKLQVNGDGFGVAWYDAFASAPGLYRDVLPAWVDDNLVHLCRMVRSPLFIGHVRASTMGETTKANCHPFVSDRVSFCHNGQIPHFRQIRRRLEMALSEELFLQRRGTTDSEILFLTLLNNDLMRDPGAAFAKTLDLLGPSTDAGPIRLTCVWSDGISIFAIRYASDNRCPTLYGSASLDNGGAALASEPLCTSPGRWQALPVNAICRLSENGLEVLSHQIA